MASDDVKIFDRMHRIYRMPEWKNVHESPAQAFIPSIPSTLSSQGQSNSVKPVWSVKLMAKIQYTPLRMNSLRNKQLRPG
jgi:hypothetical protein